MTEKESRFPTESEPHIMLHASCAARNFSYCD